MPSVSNSTASVYDGFVAALDEESLSVCHGDMPIYIPFLRSTLSMGHFVIISSGGGNSYVGQIAKRHNDPAHPQHFITVIPHLPLYSPSTHKYIGSPTLLPRAVTHLTCKTVSELVKTNYVAVVHIKDIIGLAFVFLADSVTDFMYHIQGMRNAYLIRFKYCQVLDSLKLLNSTTFHSFPDIHPTHMQFWCECYGRSIFGCIDYMRQEMWRVLCRYGQSQGLFPKHTISLFLPTIFTQYLCYAFQSSGIQPQECVASEPQRRVESTLLYKMVSISYKYLYFSLDTEEKLSVFAGIIGSMSVFGVRKRIPNKRQNSESIMRYNDLVNVVEKIDLYISSSRVKLRLFASRHQVGQPCTHVQLLNEIGNPEAREEVAVDGVVTRSNILRINSSFDYNGNVYRVVKEMPDGRILCKSVWGTLKGNESWFDKLDVIRMVKEKRG